MQKRNVKSKINPPAGGQDLPYPLPHYEFLIFALILICYSFSSASLSSPNARVWFNRWPRAEKSLFTLPIWL